MALYQDYLMDKITSLSSENYMYAATGHQGGMKALKKLEFLSLVPSQTPHPDKDKILVFMKQSPIAAIAPGIPKDRLTGEHIPCEMIAYEAFDYCWTSMDTWHYETYNFRLPEDFIAIAKEHYLDHRKRYR